MTSGSAHPATSPAPVGWARVLAAVKPKLSRSLRRGAWYPVLNDKDQTKVMLHIGGRAVPVPRRILEVRTRRDHPAYFSVVIRTPEHANPVRGTDSDLGRTYAVCPKCRARAQLFARPEQITCHGCGHRGEVAWWEA